MATYDKEYDALLARLTEFKNVAITTADLKEPYKVVGPIMNYLSNMGVYADDYAQIKARYAKPPYDQLLITIAEFTEKNEDACKTAQRLFYGAINRNEEIQEFQSELDTAAGICLAQLKLRAAAIGANAVVGVRIETEIDTSAPNLFFIKVYGTAVSCETLGDKSVVLPMDEQAPLI